MTMTLATKRYWDMGHEALLVPFGILEQSRGHQASDRPYLVFGQSRETADFIADAIELWWEERKTDHPGVDCIQIELDSDPKITTVPSSRGSPDREFSHLTQTIPRSAKTTKTIPKWSVIIEPK